MLKQRILEIVLWSFLASYLTAMVFIFSFEQQSYSNDKTKGHEVENKPFWQKLFPDSMSFFNFSLVLVTGGLVIIGIKQANATKIAADAAKNSADALTQSERAHIFVKIVYWSDISKLQTISTPITVHFIFKNHGKTPAILKTVSRDFDYWVTPPAWSLNASGNIPVSGLPTESYRIVDADRETGELICERTDLTAQQTQNIIRGQRYL